MEWRENKSDKKVVLASSAGRRPKVLCCCLRRDCCEAWGEMHRAITRCRWHALKNGCGACLVNTDNPAFSKHLCLSTALCCRCSVCCLDISLLCFSFAQNHRVFLPQGPPDHLIVGRTCLFLLKGILLCFTPLTAGRLRAGSAKASLHDLMDPVSGSPSGMGWACFRVPLVICCCYRLQKKAYASSKLICDNFYWCSCGKAHTAPSSQGTRLPWLGLQKSLLSLEGQEWMADATAKNWEGRLRWSSVSTPEDVAGSGWLHVGTNVFSCPPLHPSLPHIPHTALSYRAPFILLFPSLNCLPNSSFERLSAELPLLHSLPAPCHTDLCCWDFLHLLWPHSLVRWSYCNLQRLLLLLLSSGCFTATQKNQPNKKNRPFYLFCSLKKKKKYPSCMFADV